MHDNSIEIGSFDPAEADQLGIIFFNAVREGAAASLGIDGSVRIKLGFPSRPTANSGGAEREVPCRLHDACRRRLHRPRFCYPAHQRRGVGGLLYAQIEALARDAHIERLYSEASHLVRGLFEQQGWTVVQEQRIERKGVTLTNFVMEKRLGGSVRD